MYNLQEQTVLIEQHFVNCTLLIVHCSLHLPLQMTHSAIIIGTGFSGICMAIKLKEKGIHDFIILEKAAAVGGTWRENTYPGAECDIPSALYSYSFEPNPNWEFKWSHQPQILEYINYVAEKYGVTPHIHFQKEMIAAEWQAQKATWKVTTKDGTTYESKTFIPAIGQLHHPSTPNFKGKDQFLGTSFHSAQWNHEVSLAGKTVGVIGNAASAVQFIPEIAQTADKVIVFQRSANWMLPKQDRLYKEWEKKLVSRFPFLLKMYRSNLWLKGGALFLLMKNKNHWMRKLFEKQTVQYIKKHIDDPELVKKLIPTYPLGAKRVLFSDNYYAALNQANVDLTTSGIAEITTDGLVTKDGTKHPLDVLVYSTGFKTNPFLMGLDIKGKNGLTIQEAWKEGPENYLGITVHNFPNLFMMYGPNTNLGHNSIILMSEAQASYIAQCVEGLQKNNWQSLEVKKEVFQAFHQSIQDRLKNMIWTQIDNSWYQSANGNLPNNWPGRTMEYIRLTKKVDFDAYEIG